MDSGENLVRTMMGQLDPIQIIIRVKPSEADPLVVKRLKETIETCELFLSSSKEYKISLNQQAMLIRDIALTQLAELSDKSFEAGVFILSPSRIDSSLGNVLGSSITGSEPPTAGNYLFKSGFSVNEISVENVQAHGYFADRNRYTWRISKRQNDLLLKFL